VAKLGIGICMAKEEAWVQNNINNFLKCKQRSGKTYSRPPQKLKI
jgi:hypothetical protein